MTQAPQPGPTTAGRSQAAGASSASPQGELLQLVALFNAGRHAEMESIAALLVERHPADGLAWKALGVALQSQGKDALAALQSAASLLPADAEVASNLGGLLAARNDLPGAQAEYRRALRLQPRFASAHSGLGDVLSRQGQWPEAEASCRQAITLQPKLAAAHLNLGQALLGQARWAEAVACCRQALELRPDMVEAHCALGKALRQQGRLEAAADSLRNALRCQPNSAAAHLHLGSVLLDQGLAADAADHFREVLKHHPAQAEVWVNLGVALGAAHDLEGAASSLQQAVELQPDSAVAHNNLANSLLALGRLGEARGHLHRALALEPTLGLAQRSLAHLLKSAGEPAAALARLQQALAQSDAPLDLHSEALFVHNYLPLAEVPAEDRLAAARRFGAVAARAEPAYASWLNPRVADRLLRVGLVSPDLRNHPVGYFLESVLAVWAGQARPGLQVWAYANQRSDDATTHRLRDLCHGWRTVAELDDAALAKQIRDDGIDVLIDLAGHTRGNRLPMMALKPAPVQASWLGYCATTGLAAVDAFIADPWIAPPGSEAAFTERIVRLPETFLCFTPPAADLAVASLPALRGGVRFACFNQLAKMGDDVIAVWSSVLSTVPDSVLALQAQALQDESVRQAVCARFARCGIPPERLELRPAQANRADYLSGYNEVDIALDPFPYPGGTTSLEALWMGVPVLTLPGASALSRQGAGILHNLGLPDWVASNEQDYVAKAARHAADRPALAALRQSLRNRLLQSPLCDAPRFASNLEHGIRGLWVDWCKSAPPDRRKNTKGPQA